MSEPSGHVEQADVPKSEQLVDTRSEEPTVKAEETVETVQEHNSKNGGQDIGDIDGATKAVTAHDSVERAAQAQDGGVKEASPNVRTQEVSDGIGQAVEEEASEHLASRATVMDLTSEPVAQAVSTDAAPAERKDGDLPASPPPPIPPRKDTIEDKGKGKEQEPSEPEFDEKHPPIDPNTQEIPEAPQGTTEQTGEEIQTIMDQFQAGINSPGEQEIMSPRLEKQQPILHLPPRTSSLASAAEICKPEPERRDSESFFASPSGHTKAPSISSARTEKPGSIDDTASITSHRTSIFQPPPPSPDPEPALPFDFHRFLEQLRHRTADPVARFLRSFLQEFGKKQWAVHEQVKIIGDFLEFIAKKMAQCEVWRTVSDAEFDNAREGMEKLVMNRLYSQTFSPAIPSALSSPRKSGRDGRSAVDAANPHGPGRRGQHEEDVERDTVIAQKIRIYGWIKEDHLDIQPINVKGRSFLTLAQQELLKINTYRAPRDKVICVLNTCKVIFGFLKNSKSDQSADAFVPLLIYIVLRAAPEHLVSNVQYIWRFRNAEKLGGEAGYYMSSLMGVVTFIETLDRSALTISDEEFEHNVEAAVSAIAEGHKAEEYESKSHGAPPAQGQSLPGLQHLNEKSSLSRAEVTPRNSMDAERSSPRKQPRLPPPTSDPGSPDDDYDAVTGLLRTIQKPLSSIGRMFSDEPTPQSEKSGSRSVSATRRGLSPAARPERTSSRNRPPPPPPPPQQAQEDHQERQARAASEEAARRRRAEANTVDTLTNMFPNLDREVIEDVVRAQEGNVSRAVDACLALHG